MSLNCFRLPFQISKSWSHFRASQTHTNWNMFSRVAMNVRCCQPLTHQIQRHCRMLSNVIGAVPGATPTKGILQSVHPPVDVPDTSFASFMLSKYEKHKHLIAIENGITGETYTYDQVITKTLKTASALKKAGYKAGDTVAIFIRNSPEYLVIILAASALGLVISTVNSSYTSFELCRQLLDSKSSAIFTNSDLVPLVKEALATSSKINIKDIFVLGNHHGCRPLSSLMEDDGSAFTELAPCNSKEDTMVLPYSSGTTGMPKGVMLTHHNIISNIIQLNIFPIDEKERLVGILPFYHIYGMVVVLFYNTLYGAHIVTLPKFEPEGFLTTLQNKKIQMAHLVPPLILFLTKHPMVEDYNLCLRQILSGAAPLGKDLSIECTEKLGVNSIVQGYGLTETSPVVLLDLPPVKYSSVGTLIANTESKIIDTKTGQILGPMVSGELCIRGPQVMKGYLNKPEATAEMLKDGWLHTGDIAHYDENGYFYITERLKELIKYKGFQVPPAELESVILTHSDVQDCAVIGIPDELAGEVPRGYVVLKNDKNVKENDIAKYIENKVAPHKKLRGGVEFVSEIPKSAAGKILRRVLKDKYLSGK